MLELDCCRAVDLLNRYSHLIVCIAIAEMFSDTLQIAQDEPFKEDKDSTGNSYSEGIVGMVEKQGRS